MKKYLIVLICCIVSITRLCAFEDDELRGSTSDSTSGLGSADAATTAISISMVGWGVGLTAAIAAITILIPPDQEGTTHSHGS